MIYKKLKTVTFIYDESIKTLGIDTEFGIVSLDRIRMFSLARFILRVAQKPVKKLKKGG